jgi:phage terminase large subunit-like protein
VAPTAADARNIMVEGASGILAISPDPERALYEPSKCRSIVIIGSDDRDQAEVRV